jgi:SPP1 family predicted phage head-tail adaptor
MIGKMDSLVDVYTAAFAPDGMGGRERTLVHYDQMWAKIEHGGGEEKEHAMREADRNKIMVTVHNYDGLPIATTSVIEINGVKCDVIDRDFTNPSRLFIKFTCVSGELNG